MLKYSLMNVLNKTINTLHNDIHVFTLCYRNYKIDISHCYIVKRTIGKIKYFNRKNFVIHENDYYNSTEIIHISNNIYPGFSGAPLFNYFGQLIGIILGGGGNSGGIAVAISKGDIMKALQKYDNSKIISKL